MVTAGAQLRDAGRLPIPTRVVLGYFHVATKVRHVDQCILDPSRHRACCPMPFRHSGQHARSTAPQL